jgi:replication initiation protein RepC
MHQIMSSPVSRHARRTDGLVRPNSAPELRWQLLDLVRTCRKRLELRDRDIAVLRGLLSLLPGDGTAQVVFASNRVLIDRCDGIDERTLRRRLANLECKGLVHRRPSPNGKRYVVRDDESQTHLAYGIDMAPLFALRHHLEALADDCAREARRIAVLKARIRDALFHAGADLPPELAEQARLSLRRCLTSAEYEALLVALDEQRMPQPMPALSAAPQLTASDSQNDRHIQSSGKESSEKISMETSSMAADDLTVTDCVTLAPAACEMAAQEPRSWQDIIGLAATLGPAIGLRARVLQEADRAIGPHAAALAVMGMVQAFDRIRNPEGYLLALIRKAQGAALDPVRMFLSLVRPTTKEGVAAMYTRVTGGDRRCIPG